MIWAREILAKIAAVCFGLAFSRLGVLGSVITINTIVWEMVWEFEVFGAVDFFFYLRRTAGFYIFRGNSQGNGKPGRMCIFRACGVEIPVCVDLLFAAVELWTLKTMMGKKHVPQKQKTKNTCLSFSCSDLLSRESGLHLLTNPSFLTSSSSWHSPDPHK